MKYNIEAILVACFLFVFNTQFLNAQNAETERLLDYYEDLIDSTVRNLQNYTDPINANQFAGNYFDRNAAFEDFGEYDFVIIGGGSSGAVVASRLSEIPTLRILILEAGERENNFTDIPAFYFYSRFSDYNWGYVSTPQEGACQGLVDRRCPFPRGRALGGTSVINGLIYARGHRKDYDLWNTYISNGSWTYEDVLPYFRKSERTHVPNLDSYYHGYSGPLPINLHTPTSPQAEAFLGAHRDLGVELTDVNGANQIGAALNQLIMDQGRRVSTAQAYLNPARPNLDILTGAYVTRILTRSKRAYGVEFTYKERKSLVRVSKEVILSAGVFGSPQILMHSGIGPNKTLHRHGINLVKHLPNVGQNLHDHTTFYGLIFNSNYTEPIRSRREYIRDYLNGRGPYTISANLQAISFFETPLSQTRGVPDIELLIVPANTTGLGRQQGFRLTNETFEAIWAHADTTSTFLFYVVLLRPRSVGFTTIQSANPFDYPLINPRFLTDRFNEDLEAIYLGVQRALQLIATPSFQRIGAQLVNYTFPACSDTKYLSREYWYCTIRQISLNIYHPVGTCAMMDKRIGGVVDGELKVYGVGNLRVVDASVIPFSLSGHAHAPAVMLAEKAADIIKNNYNLAYI